MRGALLEEEAAAAWWLKSEEEGAAAPEEGEGSEEEDEAAATATDEVDDVAMEIDSVFRRRFPEPAIFDPDDVEGSMHCVLQLELTATTENREADGTTTESRRRRR